jgi:long-subunit fatty acid transport protein
VAREMTKLSLVLAGCIVSTGALAQDVKSEIAKWRACAEATAARYAQSAESAPVVARLAALACTAEKRQAVQAVARQDGERFAEEYVETIERRHIDQLSLIVIEMRLRKN